MDANKKPFVIYFIGMFSCICLCFYMDGSIQKMFKQRKVSEWHKVAISSRSETVVPYNTNYETEVQLKFSDGSSWAGTPSNVKPETKFLLNSQVGDSVSYRYTPAYFSGKQYSR